jgi:AcrR family transcriptional regulator
MVVTPWGNSETLRNRGLRPGPGIPPEEAAQNQRERLFGAMVACVSQRGYIATTVADLVDLSGVARKSFYRLFDDKQACFVAAVQATLELSLQALTSSDDGDWRERVRTDMHMLAEGIALQPAASRMTLIEAHAAGAEGLAPLEAASQFLEDFGRGLLAESEEWAEMPAEITPFHAGAAQAIARRCLVEGSEAQLPTLMDELSDLILSYPPPPEPIRTTTKPPAFAPETIDAHDRSERALRAFTAVVAERGYANASVRHAIQRASMSPTTFYAIFRDKEDVMMAAIDSAGAQLVAAIIPAFRRNPDWAVSVRAALGTFFNFLASRPALARLMLVEVHAGGPTAVARREAALAPLHDLLGRWRVRAPQMPAITIEAMNGGIYALAFKQVKEAGPESLPHLAAICTYFTLAPFIGAEAACAAANGDGLSRPLSPGADRPVGLEETPSRVLDLIVENVTASAERIAAITGLARDEVAQSLETLAESGLIEIFEERQLGERVERFYRARTGQQLDEGAWYSASQSERERISAQVALLVKDDWETSVAGGAFDRRPERLLARLSFIVDEQGWREIVAIGDKALDDAMAAQTAGVERLRRSGQEGIEGRLVQLVFEMPGREEEKS